MFFTSVLSHVWGVLRNTSSFPVWENERSVVFFPKATSTVSIRGRLCSMAISVPVLRGSC